MKKWTIFLLLLITSLLTTQCFAENTDLKNITVTEAAKAVSESSIIWLDIRETDEFKHLPKLNFAKHAPLSNFEATFTPLGIQKDQTFYIICRSGNRSKRLQNYLVSQGYVNAVNILGGMKAWRNNQK